MSDPTPTKVEPLSGLSEKDAGELGVVQTFDSTGIQRQSLTCIVRGLTDVPVDAKRFGELIVAQVRLLEAVGKEVASEERVRWVLTEANVIGDDASFTVMGVPDQWYCEQLKAAKAKALAARAAAEGRTMTEGEREDGRR